LLIEVDKIVSISARLSMSGTEMHIN